MTDSRELYVLVEDDEWARLANWRALGEKSRDRAVVPSAAELVEQLQEIVRLRAEGALTESEFEAVKARLLSDEASA